MSGKSGYSNGILRYPVSVVDHNKTLIDPQLEEIQEVIPEEASPDNMLATDDNVATSSATFRGTSDAGLTEQEFLAWADTLEKDKNDYCNWQTTEGGKAVYKRYKYDGTEWQFEYNVADPSSIPTALSQLTDDATHRLVSDTEKATWNGKADPYFQQNLSVITALSADPNAGVTTVTTNPEWKIVYTDSDDRILLGKRQDNTWYFATDLDDILDAIIDGYGS